MFEKVGVWTLNFTTMDLLYSTYEPPKPLFDHVSIESSSKFVQFMLASKNIMINSLQWERFPTFYEICIVDGKLFLLFTSHGRSIDSNDIIHTQE